MIREAYVDGLSLEIVASRFEVSLATANRWRQTDKANGLDWDSLRTAQLLSDGGLEQAVQAVLKEVLALHKRAIDELAEGSTSAEGKVKLLASLADSLAKTTRSLSRTAPKINHLSVAMDVLQNLTNFIERNYPQHRLAFMEILAPFGTELAKKHG